MGKHHTFTQPREELADLMEELGVRLAEMQGSPVLHVNGHRQDTRKSPLRGLQIPSRIFEPESDEMELARQHLAAMSPERRAQLEREWEG